MPMPGGPDGGCFYSGDAPGCIGSYPVKSPSYGGLTPEQTNQVAVHLYEEGEPLDAEIDDPTTLALLAGVVQPCDVTSEALINAEQQQSDLNQAVELVNELAAVSENLQPVFDLIFDLTGVSDAQGCAHSGSPGSCASAIFMFMPSGKLAKALKAIKDLARARRAAKALEVIKVGDLRLPGVPYGVIGVPVKTGKGLEYAIPPGTPELDPRVTSIRVMDPVTSG
jgi:hypothetical protein